MRSSRFPVNSDTPFHWQVIHSLWPYLLEHKIRVALALSCLIGAKVASVGMPFILKHVVDNLNTPAGQLVGVPLGLVLMYGVLRLSSVLLGEVRDTLFGRVTERAMHKLGLDVFAHLHQLDLEFHLNRQTGGLSRDIERGTTGISFVMRFMVFNIVPTLLELAMVTGLLFYNYGISFASVILSAVTAYVLFSVKATDWRTHYVREVNQADSNSNSRAIDSLLNYETVKYFNNETYEYHRYDQDLENWEQARRKNRLSLFALNGGQALIISLAMTAMMGLGAYHVSVGSITLGDFVLINAFTMQIFMPLNFLGFVYREIRGSLANIENLFGLMRKRSSVQDNPDAAPLDVPHGHIKFNQLAFHYHKDKPVLKDINFEIKPGQKIAIVGESGSGKSTLVKLLFRFYNATDGQITIDGQDISKVCQQSLRQAIGIVPQDTVLFNDSILENVRYGRPKASEEDVNEAIELAHLSAFIQTLPQGLNTKVGERGLKLSGGEKQRIAIARTILKRPPILLFDEATSSLDSHSEQAILQALSEISAGHTSLVIAHRLSTIIDADNILVLSQGYIAEQGNHNALLKKQGLYAGLWQAQQQSNK